MDWVLHDPEHGAYGNGALRIGPSGDFATAPSLGNDFAALLAPQCAQWLLELGDGPLALLEAGPGEGSLAADLSNELARGWPQLAARTELVVLEPNWGMAERQTGSGDQGHLALLLGAAPEAHRHRDLADRHHAEPDGLAVQPGAIATEGFHGMAEGVAVVEDRPQAALLFVCGHHTGLGGSGALQQSLEQVGPHRLPGGQPTTRMGTDRRFEILKQLRVADHPVLDHLRHAGAEFPLRQRGEGGGVDQHQPRLVEGADQVLAARVVDAGLATDGGVHHRQQGGGNLHHGDTPQPGGCGKTAHVTHHTAAEGHEQGAPLQPLAKSLVVDARHRGRCFLLFSRLQHQGGGQQARPLQARQQHGAVMAVHHRVADHQNPCARREAQRPDPLPQALQQTLPDQDGIGLLPQLHRDRAAGCGAEGHWKGGKLHHQGYGETGSDPDKNIPIG